MQGHTSSSEIRMQALREELDAANKKADRYAHLVAELSEELGNLRRSICHDCKEKFVPSYVPIASFSGDPRPSRKRRIDSGCQSSLSSLPPISTTNARGSPNTSILINALHNQTKPVTTALPTSAAPTPLPTTYAEWRVFHKSESKQAFHIDLVTTFNFENAVICVKFSPDGKYLAAGLFSGKTYVYDMEKGLNTCCLVDLYLKVQPVIYCVQFSPDNKYIATASDSGIRLWEIARKRTRAVFNDHRRSVRICFSPNGRFLLSVFDTDRCGAGVRIWSLRDGSSKDLIADTGTIWSVAISPDGRYIVAVDADGWLKIWDARTWKLLDSWKGHTGTTSGTHCIAFSPDGKGLVSGGPDGILRFWDVSPLSAMRGRVSSGQSFQQIRSLGGHTSCPINSVSFSPGCRWVAISLMDQSIQIGDPRRAEWQCTLRCGISSAVRPEVDFSPAGKYLANGGGDNHLKLWRYTEV